MISLFSVITTRLSLATYAPSQYCSPDIWTDKGGQGCGQYGGHYDAGENMTLFIESNFDGYATIYYCTTNCMPPSQEAANYRVSQITGVIVFSSQIYNWSHLIPVETSGEYYFLLQVCPLSYPSVYSTPSPVPPPPYSQKPNLKLEQSNCPTDYTWIDVGGSTTQVSSTSRVARTSTMPSTQTSALSTSTTQVVATGTNAQGAPFGLILAIAFAVVASIAVLRNVPKPSPRPKIPSQASLTVRVDVKIDAGEE
jgi:hypothetical protein